MLNTLLARKGQMVQTYFANGVRIPVTIIQSGPCLVTKIKSKETDGYQAIQLGFGQKKAKLVNRPLLGNLKHINKNGMVPRYLKEIRDNDGINLKLGDTVLIEQILKPGDLVDVTGKSKGRGFTGVMKRWGFKGGPKTHGQSDRARAPGSIGQTTTPGRVYKGKRMAGRSGNATVTIKNLLVVKVDNNGEVWIKGQVPGSRNGLLVIKKVGTDKQFPGLYQEEGQIAKEDKK